MYSPKLEQRMPSSQNLLRLQDVPSRALNSQDLLEMLLQTSQQLNDLRKKYVSIFIIPYTLFNHIEFEK